MQLRGGEKQFEDRHRSIQRLREGRKPILSMFLPLRLKLNPTICFLPTNACLASFGNNLASAHGRMFLSIKKRIF